MKENGWYIVGSPFVNLDGKTTYTLNESFATGFAKGDMLYTLSSNGVFTPHYWNTANEGWSTHVVAWREDLTEYPSDAAIYIYKKGGAGSITFSGKVESLEVEVGSEEGNNWSLTATVWPEETTLDAMNWSGFTKGDMLYTIDEDGRFTPHYWNATNNGWSTHVVAWREETKPLAVGQALYFYKKSAGLGSFSQK